MKKSFFYKIFVQYNGTNFLGWQIQANQGRTVQGELYLGLGKICKSDQIKVVGAGRTDAGVHAFKQVAKITIPIELSPDALLRALNANLCHEIRIVDVHRCEESFHPIRDAKWKEYIYVFTNFKEESRSPFLRNVMANYPFDFDYELMAKGASLFVGKKDFLNFYCTGSEVNSTIRTIFSSELSLNNEEGFFSSYCPKYYIFKVKGDGFLKQMVRLIVGSLWNLGRGKIQLEDLEYALQKKLDKRLGMVAPAEGLYLREIMY